jgi:hypothetical protein
MEVTTLSRGGGFFLVTMSDKTWQPCLLYRFARYILIGEKSEKCLSRELKGRKESERNEVQQKGSSLLFGKVLKGTRVDILKKEIKIKLFYFSCSDVFRQIAAFFGGTDPFVRRLLLCCNDVESNPGPLNNAAALASDDNSSTGSNRSVKNRQVGQKDRQGGLTTERSAASNAERLSKFERTLIRNEFVIRNCLNFSNIYCFATILITSFRLLRK